jgi:deoxycytidylate deaminase
MEFDWNELAFASKKPVNELNATFIAAPRELSPARFRQMVKQYLPQGNVLLGLAKEKYVLGLEGESQFETLQANSVSPLIEKVNASESKHKVYTLAYFQRDLPFILEKLDLARLVLVNGSWYRVFHLRPEYYTLVNRKIPFEKVSPFVDEDEAKAYAEAFSPPPLSAKVGDKLTEEQMLGVAQEVAKRSFDFGGFQTGVALGRNSDAKYELLATAFNRVVPYQTYAMHHGAARELHFSPANDLNYYDTNHAEVELLAEVLRSRLNLAGTTLFINLLPCPTCARMLAATDIAEIVYQQDHSDGYAIGMLEQSGKLVRRSHEANGT